MKKLVVVGTLAVLTVLAYSQRESIITRVMEKGLAARMECG